MTENKKTHGETEKVAAREEAGASRQELLGSVAEVSEGEFRVTLSGGRTRVLRMSGFRFVRQQNEMYAEAAAMAKALLPVPLPAGDPSGERSFKPDKEEVYTAVFLAHGVAEPKMTANEWLIFTRRNSFEADRASTEVLRVMGLAPAAVPASREGGEPGVTFEGVKEARERLEADPFPAAADGDQPAPPALSP